MPGMNSGLDAASPALVAAFRSALLHQLAIIAAIAALLLLAYLVIIGRRPEPRRPRPVPTAEPSARQFLRIAFGVLWIFDAILQAQPKMAGGLPSQIVEPIAASSPGWVQHVVNFGGTVWSYHPVQAAAASVWIQAGLGIWLIAAATGWSSRLAGLSSVAWGLVVWVFGEAFGGIFAPGLSWLTGAPGAVVLYVLAGALVALPPRAWVGTRLGRLLLAGTGLFWAGMALLQAWPGRGYWQGGDSGTLTGMVSSMAQVSQPHAQAAMVSAFASFTSAHGFAVNLFTVIALAVAGVAFIVGQPRLVRVAVPAAAVFCLAVWALVQDFGVPGGLGTDPNSMLVWVLLLWGGLVAVTRPAMASPEDIPFPAPSHPAVAVRRVVDAANARSLTALGAVAVILVGAAPMALASANRNADPIIAQAMAGSALRVDRPAPDFQLVSESGVPVSLASLRGKAVVLTFLDPVCVGCPQIAREMHQASALLGSRSARVEFVAIEASSMHSGLTFVRAFDQHQGLTRMPNWMFLTGSGAELQQAWNSYERVAPHMMAGMMVRSQIAFAIDAAGRIRLEIRDGPGPATASAQSSFAVLLADSALQVLS